MCGLSSNQPFCDGSHKKTADEEADKVYRYNLMEQGLRSNRNNFILFMERIRFSKVKGKIDNLLSHDDTSDERQDIRWVG
jgi:hypothetical protein